MVDFIKLPADELLSEFGVGKHKPGSGSAVALQGMISAKLIQTLVNLTKKKPGYEHVSERCEKIRERVENSIYPELQRLFQLDAEQFDTVIRLRRSRKKVEDVEERKRLEEKIEDVTIPATETPIAIAKLCVELSDDSLFLFDNGFQAARGDSGVALNGAISAIAGCLSIINLNLLSLGHNKRIEKIRNDAVLLRIKYQEMLSKANDRLINIEEEAYRKELNYLSSGQWSGANLSYEQIEQVARRFQNALWIYHDKILKEPAPENVIDILKPETVLTKILDYQYSELPSLGLNFVEGETFEIAGVIDKSNKHILVSQSFSKETQNFTAAHELGHALLHKQLVLHRDRALDGSNAAKDTIEIEANKFAAFFLMPKKQVENVFRRLFLTDKFVINENTIFALTKNSNVNRFKKECKHIRGLCKILATAEFYGNQPFKSIAEIFHVSTETMAIRLEELKLAEF